MKLYMNEYLKEVRKELKMTQEAFSERLNICSRQYQNMELGKTPIDLERFLLICEITGRPVEDYWLLLSDTEQYQDYENYRMLKHYMRDGLRLEAEELLKNIDVEKLKEKAPLLYQYIRAVQISFDREISDEDAINEMTELMKIFHPDYDESKIAEYRLSHGEISIINNMSIRLSRLGQDERAIKILEDSLVDFDNALISHEDRKGHLPLSYFNLASKLTRVDYIKALKVAKLGLEEAKKSGWYRHIPHLMAVMAESHYKLYGEKDRAMLDLKITYYTAIAHNDTLIAEYVRKFALEELGERIE